MYLRLAVLAFALGAAAVAGEEAARKELPIDLDKAVAVKLPAIEADLVPAAFKTPDGKEGWVVRIPGCLPIATPAYADGRLFVGGGYGSHEFYAFDAATGKLAWAMKTADDGPTAAVVEDGCVAFNTESCTVIVVEAKTGKLLWQKWLGDPLMSQPAIAKGRLYIAYPDSRGDGKHRLWCADLKTGTEIWKREITGDIISAPVIADDRLYFTCFDGTSFCVGTGDGEVVWTRKNAGTSAPLIYDGQLIYSAKGGDETEVLEGLKRADAESGTDHDEEALAAGTASYLKDGGGVAVAGGEAEALDEGVGFGAPPAAAKLAEAEQHVGIATVFGGWAYQGARATAGAGQMMMAQGLAINCLRIDDGRANWRAVATGKGIAEGQQLFSPPSLGRERLYLCSARGHLLAVEQESGAVAFMYDTGLPMVFQPALADGNLYAGTAGGLLICLKTGDKDVDGWFAWGGNAQHNKCYDAPEPDAK